MKKERTPQKKKDTEEETRKEEKPSDTYRIFFICPDCIWNFWAAENESPCLEAPPGSWNQSPPAAQRKPVLVFYQLR